MYYERGNEKPKGLKNNGGNCYMNALLQCLYYCRPMTNYFKTLNRCSLERFGLISKSYYDFVHSLRLGNLDSALHFQKNLMMVKEFSIVNNYKDSKELALFILSEMNKELKLEYIQNKDKNYDMCVYQEKILSHKINNTIITNIFFYDILCRQISNNKFCRYSKTFGDIQSNFIMEFPIENIYNNRNSSYPNISIEDCLKYFSRTEIIKCPSCYKHPLKIEKLICKLPEIFIFAISRDKNSKVKCKINFPMTIDIYPFYIPLNKPIKDNTRYNLICATFENDNHNIAFCKALDNKYYTFNDQIVEQTYFSKIMDNIPYLLFYEKSK